MDHSAHNKLVSFIWSIADDCLRDVYVRGKYRDVILVPVRSGIGTMALEASSTEQDVANARPIAASSGRRIFMAEYDSVES